MERRSRHRVTVADEVRPRPAEVPDRLFFGARDVDARLGWPERKRCHEPPCVARVGLHLGPWGNGDEEGAITSQSPRDAAEQPGKVVAGRAGLVAEAHHDGSPSVAMKRLTEVSSGNNRSRTGTLAVRVRTAEVIESRWMSRATQVSFGRTACGHGRLLPYGGSAHVDVGNPRHMRNGPAVHRH